MVRRGNREKRLAIQTDPDLERRFLAAVRSGSPLAHAARQAGFTVRTMWRTLEHGRAADEARTAGESLTRNDRDALAFLERVEEARSQVVVKNFALIQKVAQGGYLVEERTLPNGTVERKFAPPDWRAADKMLVRSFPGEFAESHRMELTGAGGGPVQVEASESVRRLAQMVRASVTRDDEPEVLDGEVVGEIEA